MNHNETHNPKEKRTERVRAIIIDSERILLIKRIKKDVSYWVIPGGGVEVGENHEQAVKRECFEELGIQVCVGRLFFQRTADMLEIKGQKEFFYLCKMVGGEVGTGQGPEFQPGVEYQGEFKAGWVDIKKLAAIDLRPSEIRDAIITFTKNEKN